MPKAKQPVREIWPNPKQYEFLTSTTRHTAYGGARGGGKSWVAREQAVEDGMKYGRPNIWSQGIRICFIRRTLVDLLKNHLEAMKLITAGYAKYNANDKCFYFRNGAIIQFAYCDCDADADHFQGIEYDEIFIEEATQLQPEWITKIAASCRGINDFPHRVFYTCNPGGPGHAHIKRLFVDRIFKDDEVPEDYSFIQAKVTDNAILQKYSPEYVNFLKNLPPKIRSAWLDGDWNIYSGMYFNEFINSPEHYDDRRWTHVINPIKIRPHWNIYRGLDWGHFKPFAVGWFAIDEDGIMYHFKELYGVQKSGGESLANEGVEWPPEQLFNKIREIEENDPDLKGKQIIGVADPAIFQSQTGTSIADTAVQCGVYFQKGDNTRIPGWMQCRYRMQFNEFGVPRFYVFNTCREFIRTIPTLQHDERIEEDLETKKSEDHIADMWRYVCMANVIKPFVEEPQFNPAWGADPLGTVYGSRRS